MYIARYCFAHPDRLVSLLLTVLLSPTPTSVVPKLGVNCPSGVICDSSGGNAEPKI